MQLNNSTYTAWHHQSTNAIITAQGRGLLNATPQANPTTNFNGLAFIIMVITVIVLSVSLGIFWGNNYG